jgi:hypothetical protein
VSREDRRHLEIEIGADLPKPDGFVAGTRGQVVTIWAKGNALNLVFMAFKLLNALEETLVRLFLPNAGSSIKTSAGKQVPGRMPRQVPYCPLMHIS